MNEARLQTAERSFSYIDFTQFGTVEDHEGGIHAPLRYFVEAEIIDEYLCQVFQTMDLDLSDLLKTAFLNNQLLQILESSDF